MILFSRCYLGKKKTKVDEAKFHSIELDYQRLFLLNVLVFPLPKVFFFRYFFLKSAILSKFLDKSFYFTARNLLLYIFLLKFFTFSFKRKILIIV